MQRIFDRSGKHRSGWVPLVALIATAALLAGPAAALAQQGISPAGDQYDTFPEQVDETVGDGAADDPGDPVSDERGTADRDRAVSALPFTGLDLGLLVAAAGLLGLSGFALRRLTGGSNASR